MASMMETACIRCGLCPIPWAHGRMYTKSKINDIYSLIEKAQQNLISGVLFYIKR